MKRGTQYLGIAGLICLLFGSLHWMLVAQDELMISAIHLLLGVVLLAVFIIRGGLQIFRSSSVQRSAGYGVGVTMYSALFVGVLAVANYIVARSDLLHFDSTEEKVYTLAPQTISVIRALKEPITIRAFYLGGKVDLNVKDLLDRMKRESSKVSWSTIDPEKKPQLAEKYGINEQGSLHFSFDGSDNSRVSKISGEVDEQAIVNAILKLTRGGEKKVYYLTGNGERDLASNEPSGYLFLKEAIEGENIKVEEIKLSETSGVPADASALLVLAPDRELPPFAQTMITSYIEKGGNAIFMTEPQLKNGLPALAKKFGIEIGTDIVVDQVMKIFAGPSLGVQPVISTYGDHPITSELKHETILSTVSSVRSIDPENSEVTELAFSSQKSWAERKLDLIFGDEPQAELDGDDLKGPISVAAAFEGKLGAAKEQSATPETAAEDAASGPESRVVVVGDSDWVANVNLSVAFNRDLFLNMLNWTVGETESLTIRPRTLRQSLKKLTDQQFTSMFIVGAILLPEALLLGGFAVWWFRKE